jgi:hypothetical protein
VTLFALAKLVHVASVLWMISGFLGRTYALGASRKSTDVRQTKLLGDLAGRFETTMIIPGFSVVFISGIATALFGQYSILGPFQDGPVWIFASLLLYIGIGLLVPTVFLPRGKLFGAALDEALSQGQVTARLRSAFADPATRWAHRAELGALALIVALMVLKPF